jgi:hypothetical protein
MGVVRLVICRPEAGGPAAGTAALRQIRHAASSLREGQFVDGETKSFSQRASRGAAQICSERSSLFKT